ncbi:MAG: PLP-dependent aminotransferase family protein [Solirubrobacteraceae bacterium]
MVSPGTNSPIAADLLISLERGDGGEGRGRGALHQQLEAGIRDAIRSGRLPQGAALPPTRAFATELGVSRGVVVEAYAQLVAEGYLNSRSGGYTRVAAASSGEAGAARAPADSRTRPKPSVDFGYGRANVAAFPRAAWLRSVRTALTEAPDERLGYLDGHGTIELRQALTEYLNRIRGTVAIADNVAITNGYAQGVALLLGVLAARGARRLAVEDPSANDDARVIAAGLGLDVVGVPVGPEGVRIDALAQLDADALILTPSHQWPTGAVLSAPARAAVVGWARARGALIIEDDYDAEFRYDRTPVGAIQGLAPELVAYAGTASKTLAPGFRLGWFVLPAQLVQPFAEAKLLADRGSPVLDQLTFADFLRRGEFDRHLRRLRPVYRARRDALVAALAQRLPQLRPAGIAAGLHLVTWLPAELDETEVVQAAAAQGVAVVGLEPYRVAPSAAGGLIFGYSTIAETAIHRGIGLLADAIAELSRR